VSNHLLDKSNKSLTPEKRTPKLLTYDNPAESKIEANNSLLPNLSEDIKFQENSFQTSDNQTLFDNLMKFTSKNKYANDAVKKL
jgi:hypothetical protein